ncbi:MAG: DUF2905 domain-containing protein [Selenomonadaceae bacterium]
MTALFFNGLGKNLIYLGFIILVIGLILHFGSKFLPLGRLPGDFSWGNDRFSVHFPLMTSILVSIVLTLLLNIFFR